MTSMNRLHQWICSSDKWARGVERSLLPWALDGVEPGAATLEIGPGYGATTRVLERRVPGRLSVLEVDADFAKDLQETYGERVEVVHGDGTSMPFPDGGFDTVVCFTMLHHVPSPEQQDRLFAEAGRVLRPGGVFAGCDGCASVPFRLLHLGDTYVPVPPDTLPRRLRAAGFGQVDITVTKGRFRFRAVRCR
ncbi:SAM-dependent methyltransferase [Streptomyces sp. WAC 06783]|uniref:class I SAM-dependent methyltransferase n=1 Tax=Streptomyces sp. WAC 06783 TaxID=2203211 RepID=UPI000F7413EC|nr:class I SAM-dependent methyltransferase [Streptomyces sp. WAC 06783]RSO09347.1 SAM-dependent methyltransferase [Streptomyces sp. WAC 06783]